LEDLTVSAIQQFSLFVVRKQREQLRTQGAQISLAGFTTQSDSSLAENKSGQHGCAHCESRHENQLATAQQHSHHFMCTAGIEKE
jgi:hypothetical protein